jgi:hypothetical protein
MRAPRGFGTCVLNHRVPEAAHDTACITYRCFLPDLTRFVTVCCVAPGRMNPGHTSQSLGESVFGLKSRWSGSSPSAEFLSIRPRFFFASKKRSNRTVRLPVDLQMGLP